MSPRAAMVAALALGAGCAFDAGRGFATLESGTLHGQLEPGPEVDGVELRRLELGASELRLLGREDDDEPAVVVRMPIEREIDLLSGADVALEVFEPSRELGLVAIDRAELVVDRVVVEVEAEGAQAIAADVAVEAVIATELGVVIDREAPETIELEAAVRCDGTLFDGSELAEERIAEWVAEAELLVDLGVGEHEDDHDNEEAHDHE